MAAGTVTLTVLGARGSMPVSGENYLQFGGNTSCYLLRQGQHALFLDAGTGLMHAPDLEGDIHILLTHTHIDHILGLPMYRALLQEGRTVHIYAMPHASGSVQEQLQRLIAPPLWPVTLSEYPSDIHLHDLTQPFSSGPFAIDWIPSHHPGGSLIYGIRCGEKRIVYATDYSHQGDSAAGLIAFSRDADLLLYDAQYTVELFENRPGFGHSTAEMGRMVQQKAHVKQLLLVHHDPGSTDAMLQRREQALGVTYAREGVLITL